MYFPLKLILSLHYNILIIIQEWYKEAIDTGITY